jgi:hypothetical protein
VIRGTVLHIFVRGEMGIGVSVANTDERYRASTVRQICVLYSSSLLILHCFLSPRFKDCETSSSMVYKVMCVMLDLHYSHIPLRK